MCRKKTIAFTVLLSFLSVGLHAQRHYSGISGVEVDMGGAIFNGPGYVGSLEYSKYKSKVSFWKMGLNYMSKVYSDSITSENRYADNVYLSASYNRTVATNRKSVFCNVSGGLLTGVEMYTGEEKKAYDYILGCKLSCELELFVASRTAMVISATQYWSPLSAIRKWDTTWQVGIKHLIY